MKTVAGSQNWPAPCLPRRKTTAVRRNRRKSERLRTGNRRHRGDLPDRRRALWAVRNSRACRPVCRSGGWDQVGVEMLNAEVEGVADIEPAMMVDGDIGGIVELAEGVAAVPRR